MCMHVSVSTRRSWAGEGLQETHTYELQLMLRITSMAILEVDTGFHTVLLLSKSFCGIHVLWVTRNSGIDSSPHLHVVIHLC